MIETMYEMVAEPVIPAWTLTGGLRTAGSELQRAILRGFPVSPSETNQPLVKIFTFKEHGEFFRGALTMASIRYPGDFYELLQRYQTIKVTISTVKKETE